MNKGNKAKRRVPYIVYPIIGAVFLAFIFIISMTVGQYSITFVAAIKALFGNAEKSMDAVVVFQLRLPRTAVACLVGIALSLSGLIYQSTFQNELVSPDIIGVSSGASVGVAMGLLLGIPLLAVSGLGFVFGAVALLLTLLITRTFRNKSPLMLIIAGILVSGLMSAIVSLIKAYANADTTLPAIVFWLLGSFSSVQMVHVWILLPIVAICAAFLFAISGKIINNIALGREEAKSKGINYKAWRIVILVIGTILTASSVAVAGSIGWVGLVIPHMTRLLVGHTAQKTIPVATVLGGSFMIIADILSRTITNSETPVGAITGIIGIVVFIIILAAQSGRNYGI